MPQILKNRWNFTLRRLLDLDNTFLEQNLRLKTLGYLLYIPVIFFICCLTAPWPTFSCYRGNCLTHPMLITSFGLSIFGPNVTRRDWISTRNWVPSGLWSQCHNPLSHSLEIAKNTQNSYSLTLWLPLGLNNTSLDARFSAKNFIFSWCW